ncbi:MAG: hypothetical protein HYV40_01600 [Candidatus Levybacteria bacterium]|nr:hypothetical protein [Candidatus Levybacteria bacterium]
MNVFKKYKAALLLISVAIFLIVALVTTQYYLLPAYTQAKQHEQAGIAANTVLQACKDAYDFWRHCYEVEVEKMSQKYPLPVSLLAFSKIQALDNRTNECHVIAHAIMKQYVTDHPDNWTEYAQQIDPYSCNYGFIHGIVEARSMVDKTFVLSAQTIPELCSEFSKHTKTQGLEETCAHIMGHVLLVNKEGDIDDAVTVCKNVPSRMQRECFAGSFMESYTRTNLVAHGIAEYVPWNDETIQKQETLCKSYTDLPAFSCWQEISHMYNSRTRYQPEAVFAQCQVAGEERLIDSCYLHAVNELTQNNNADDAYLSKLCMPYDQKPPQYQTCMNTIIRSLIYDKTALAERALQFCTVVNTQHARTCFQIIGGALERRATQEEKQLWCGKAPEEYREICKNAA